MRSFNAKGACTSRPRCRPTRKRIELPRLCSLSSLFIRWAGNTRVSNLRTSMCRCMCACLRVGVFRCVFDMLVMRTVN